MNSKQSPQSRTFSAPVVACIVGIPLLTVLVAMSVIFFVVYREMGRDLAAAESKRDAVRLAAEGMEGIHTKEFQVKEDDHQAELDKLRKEIASLNSQLQAKTENKQKEEADVGARQRAEKDRQDKIKLNLKAEATA